MVPVRRQGLWARIVGVGEAQRWGFLLAGNPFYCFDLPRYKGFQTGFVLHFDQKRYVENRAKVGAV